MKFKIILIIIAVLFVSSSAGVYFLGRKPAALPTPTPQPLPESQFRIPEQVVSQYIENRFGNQITAYEIIKSSPQKQPAIYTVIASITRKSSPPATYYFSVVKKDDQWTVATIDSIPIVGPSGIVSTPPLP